MLSTSSKAWEFGGNYKKKAQNFVALPVVSRAHLSNIPAIVWPGSIAMLLPVLAYLLNHKKTIIDVTGTRVVHATVNYVPKTAVAIAAASLMAYYITTRLQKQFMSGNELKDNQIIFTNQDGEEVEKIHTLVPIKNKDKQPSAYYTLLNTAFYTVAFTGAYSVQGRVLSTLTPYITYAINFVTRGKLGGFAQAIAEGFISGLQKEATKTALAQISYGAEIAMKKSNKKDFHNHLADNIQWFGALRNMTPGVFSVAFITLVKYGLSHYQTKNVYLDVFRTYATNCLIDGVLGTLTKRALNKVINGEKFGVTGQDIIKDVFNEAMYTTVYAYVAPKFSINDNQSVNKQLWKTFGRNSVLNGTIEVATEALGMGFNKVGPDALNTDLIPSWNGIKSKLAHKSAGQRTRNEIPLVDPVNHNGAGVKGQHAQGVNNRRGSDDLGQGLDL